MPALTRGPLPARVYWVRRLVVLGVALLLVVGIARLLGGGSNGSDPKADAAANVSAPASTTQSSDPTSDPASGLTVSPSVMPTLGASAGVGGRGATGSATPVLAAPEGTCSDSDVSVTPQVDHAVAGRDVKIVLLLRTMSSPACTWQTGRRSLALDITSGKDAIWSSRECPRAIPVQDVVVRRDVTTRLAVTWDARRSDQTCSRFTEWAMPGFYHVTAAAVGAEPADAQFELTTPVAGTVTRTASPTQSPSQSPSRAPQAQSSGRPVTSPHPSSSSH
jgi:hypothetical protein